MEINEKSGGTNLVIRWYHVFDQGVIKSESKICSFYQFIVYRLECCVLSLSVFPFGIKRVISGIRTPTEESTNHQPTRTLTQQDGTEEEEAKKIHGYPSPIILLQSLKEIFCTVKTNLEAHMQKIFYPNIKEPTCLLGHSVSVSWDIRFPVCMFSQVKEELCIESCWNQAPKIIYLQS